MNTSHVKAFSIIEALVALAIIMAAVLMISGPWRTLRRSIEGVKVQQEVESIREYLMHGTSCIKTLQPFRGSGGAVVCNNGTIPLLRDDGSALAIAMPTWAVDVRCTNTGLVVKVELLANGATRLHPVDGRRLDHANSMLNPLFGQGSDLSLCAADFRSSSRARKIWTPLATIGSNDGECATIHAVHSMPPSGPGSSAYRQPFTTMTDMHAGCSNFCRDDPQLAKGGYLIDCAAGQALCTCFR